MIGNGLPTWPFATAVVLLGGAALACVFPLYSRSERVGAVIVAPQRAFQGVAAEPDWVGPFFAMLVAGLVLSVGFIGKMLPDIGDDFPGQLRLPMMIGLPVFIFLFGLVSSVACWAIRAGAIWIIARLAGKHASYRSLFSVVGYAYIPQVLLAALVMAGAVGFGFVEFSVADISNAVPPTSLLWLLPEGTVNAPVAKSLTAQIELFALWSLALTIIGVQRVYAFDMSKAAAVVLLYWILDIAAAAGFVALMMGLQQLLVGG